MGLIFAAFQFWETRQFDKMQNSMVLVDRIKSREFISSYKNVLEHNERNINKSNDIIDDLNYLASNYEYISIMYSTGNVNKQFLKENISIDKVAELLVHYKYPKSGMRNILKLQREVNEK